MPKKKSTTSKKRNPARKAGRKKTPQPSTLPDKSVREEVLSLLGGGKAHIDFEAAMSDWPVQLAAAKVANFPHTAWMLLEHMRIGQWDILEFSRNSKHISPPWPKGYWPESEAPPSEKAWKSAMTQFKTDLRAMQQLVTNSKTDLYAKLPWGDGQTILREALLVADHNAYHLGQLVMLRKCMGI
jgi:hypothetical protein